MAEKKPWYEELETELDAKVSYLVQKWREMPIGERHSAIGGIVALLKLAWEHGLPTPTANHIARKHENLPVLFQKCDDEDAAKFALHIITDFLFQKEVEVVVSTKKKRRETDQVSVH